MCQGIEKVFQLASKTFSKKTNPENVKKNLELLISHTNKLTTADVGLEQCAVLKDASTSPKSTQDSPPSKNRYKASEHKAPVTYIPVTETMDISIGIFVIREGEDIPLHDHPCMHGVIKCLSGSLRITSFTKKEQFPHGSVPDKIRRSPQLMEKLRYGQLFLAERLEPPINLTPESGSCVLEPKKNNIHRIESVGGPAAFLDILAPPYNIDPTPLSPDTQERDCHYFRVLSEAGPVPNTSWLILSNPPASFYCDTEPYMGPEIREG